MSERNFVPVITINNSKELKTVEIEGKEQKVEVPAKEGFNIESKDMEGIFEKHFFLKDLEAVILFDRYQIQSKYKIEPTYRSNEFEFTGPRNNVRAYSNSEKRVLFEGPYADAKEFFSTGQETPSGSPEKTFDVFTILYILVEGEVLRFKWKMNQNNTWFGYKDGCEDERGDRGYRGIKSKFALEKKKFGSNEFWACNLQNVGKVDRAEADKVGDSLELALDEAAASFGAPASPAAVAEMKEEADEINVSGISF